MKRTALRGWGDDSVGETLVMQAQGLEFKWQTPRETVTQYSPLQF